MKYSGNSTESATPEMPSKSQMLDPQDIPIPTDSDDLVSGTGVDSGHRPPGVPSSDNVNPQNTIPQNPTQDLATDVQNFSRPMSSIVELGDQPKNNDVLPEQIIDFSRVEQPDEYLWLEWYNSYIPNKSLGLQSIYNQPKEYIARDEFSQDRESWPAFRLAYPTIAFPVMRLVESYKKVDLYLSQDNDLDNNCYTDPLFYLDATWVRCRKTWSMKFNELISLSDQEFKDDQVLKINDIIREASSISMNQLKSCIENAYGSEWEVNIPEQEYYEAYEEAMPMENMEALNSTNAINLQKLDSQQYLMKRQPREITKRIIEIARSCSIRSEILQKWASDQRVFEETLNQRPSDNQLQRPVQENSQDSQVKSDDKFSAANVDTSNGRAYIERYRGTEYGMAPPIPNDQALSNQNLVANSTLEGGRERTDVNEGRRNPRANRFDDPDPEDDSRYPRRSSLGSHYDEETERMVRSRYTDRSRTNSRDRTQASRQFRRSRSAGRDDLYYAEADRFSGGNMRRRRIRGQDELIRYDGHDQPVKEDEERDQRVPRRSYSEDDRDERYPVEMKNRRRNGRNSARRYEDDYDDYSYNSYDTPPTRAEDDETDTSGPLFELDKNSVTYKALDLMVAVIRTVVRFLGQATTVRFFGFLFSAASVALITLALLCDRPDVPDSVKVNVRLTGGHDDGYWATLSQTLLCLFTLYCIFVPLFRNQSLNIPMGLFGLTLSVSAGASIASMAVYDNSWRWSLFLGWLAGVCQVVATVQLTEGVGVNNSK